MVGLIDNSGRRKWSAITNWIDVSVDGRLTSVASPAAGGDYEEYDVNFMALATRKTWSLNTFMNYNRLIDNIGITETVSVPVKVNGIYGNDSSWRPATPRSNHHAHARSPIGVPSSYA